MAPEDAAGDGRRRDFAGLRSCRYRASAPAGRTRTAARTGRPRTRRSIERYGGLAGDRWRRGEDRAGSRRQGDRGGDRGIEDGAVIGP